MRYIALISIILISFFVCSKDSKNITISYKDSFSTPLEYWNSLSIHDYSISQTIKSWYPWHGDTVKITIYSDTIYKIQKIPEFSSIEKSEWNGYKSISDLFDLASLDTTTFELEVKYDSTYYYPEYLYYKPHPPIYTEGGFSYFTCNLEIL